MADRRVRKAAMLAKGLSGGEKVGKHRVRSGDVAVQLEEDLSENLRQLKVRAVMRIEAGCGTDNLLS